MRRLMMLAGLMTAISVVVAACGTPATPRYEAERLAAEANMTATLETELTQAAERGEAVAIVPTNTPEPTATNTPEPSPTFTPEPPTATPLPTNTPTPTPFGADDPLFETIANADVANGEALFAMIPGGAPCSSCHLISEETLVGPGQYNLLYRAAERVEGEGPYTYMYHSVVEPNAHVVEGYPEMVMPQNYADLLTEQQIYDIVAYMASLRDEQPPE